ncbi:sulfonate transport system substrate-binding protein [Amphibacillus marinus]|uniref:Putative aliphatic sulfonates-binding protein n=1 Tax=Amphibacillus marinus TaxID=872970 RepID=A0A1H8IRN3_9BACI|nr:aliphatic sulfonate ABC transporter substrate-binding protein [Amphibacillus marinus]SEN71313.1 sulfonate transport system substrate-binding protein [Amphibacillus marinus]
MKKVSLLGVLLTGLLFIAACAQASGGDHPDTIRLDYAHYSPTSLVLKQFGWVEETFEEEDIEIEWVFSQGSNRALEFLNSNSVDFGSTAGAAALISKANGSPIENVYIYSKPEWTALVTGENSDVSSIQDLSGKTVAATIGTDPYIFLLRALAHEGVDPSEVEIVNLQHGDGASSLLSGQVDAWAGLDPHMARVEVEANASLFYREPDFNTYGFLNVREAFAEEYPDYVEQIISLYEQAREWIIDNPEEAITLLATEAEISEAVAALQLERNDFSEPIPGDIHREALIESGYILQESEVIDAAADIEDLVEALINPEYAERTIN